MTSPKKLLIMGGAGTIGREVCRLTNAMAHQAVGVDRRGGPGLDEPWVHGVQWITGDAFDPDDWLAEAHGAEACVVCIPLVAYDSDAMARLTSALSSAGVSRLVFAIPADDSARVETAGAGTPQTVVAQFGRLGDEPDEAVSASAVGDTMRIERLGMALLRAALEPDVGPRLTHEELWRLGDAVMIQ